MNIFYLKEEIFSWHARTDTGNYSMQDGWSRPYEYLDIAYKVIRDHKVPIELIDCISNLKRAIDHRVKKIVSDYQFKSMSRFGLDQDHLQKFEVLGLAKPAVLKTITSIRNVLEHQFKDPPGVERCSELADFTWYFLKSTDSVCRDIPSSFTLNCEYLSGYDSDYWLEFSLGKEKFWDEIKVRGWLILSHFDFQQLSTARVMMESVRVKKEEGQIEISMDQLHGLDNDVPIYIRAKCYFSNETYKKLVQSYFSADRHL